MNIKVAVEIDGSQHELEDRKLKDNEKDKVLNQNGWRVYRIPAKFLFSIETSDEAIGKFIIFISNFEIENSSCLGITSSKERNKIKKEEYKQSQIENKQNFIDDKINQIKKSDIDFAKFGWVQKVSKILEITPQKVNQWMKRNMESFYEERCFKRL